jgi:hypothetical protein
MGYHEKFLLATKIEKIDKRTERVAQQFDALFHSTQTQHKHNTNDGAIGESSIESKHRDIVVGRPR